MIAGVVLGFLALCCATFFWVVVEPMFERRTKEPEPPKAQPCPISGSHFHVLNDGRRLFCEGSKVKDPGRRAGKMEGEGLR